LAAESAKADFVPFQRRIHSLGGRTRHYLVGIATGRRSLGGRTARDLAGSANRIIRSGSGRAGARDAACSQAAESAQADFVYLLRRIYSLCMADGT
jgi:hypothetical protein